MWHTNLMMHRVIIQTVLDIDFFCRHVILLCQVVLTAHADEGIHLLHQAAQRVHVAIAVHRLRHDMGVGMDHPGIVQVRRQARFQRPFPPRNHHE